MQAKESRKLPHMYTINELSVLCDVTARTLRHYEEMGLLEPERRGNQRLYRERDRVRLQLILRGRRLGFGLRDIQDMLNLYDADPTEATQLQEVIRRGDTKLSELEAQMEELRAMMVEIMELRSTMQRRLENILKRED